MLDTRQKIIDPVQAVRIVASGAIVVSGYFDPLIAAHAERLAKLKPANSKLLVLIATPPNAILPAAARAELVAGLRAVDYVSELADGVHPQIRLEEEDNDRYRMLLQRVHARQKAAF
jgi:glycerol-3-phosphate cytidylyltransferase-like family protein